MKQPFNIPEGCKTVTVEQVGNQIITSFEPEKYVPKACDLVKVTYDSGNTYFFEISKFDGFLVDSCGVIIAPEGVRFCGSEAFYTYSSIKKLTPEEFQAEFDKLGYVYDFKTHTAYKKRWRADLKGCYYFVSAAFDVESDTEENHSIDAKRHKSGNYFKNEEDASVYRNYMLQHSLNFHKQ